jgi:hypothetical protein
MNGIPVGQASQAFLISSAVCRRIGPDQPLDLAFPITPKGNFSGGDPSAAYLKNIRA